MKNLWQLAVDQVLECCPLSAYWIKNVSLYFNLCVGALEIITPKNLIVLLKIKTSKFIFSLILTTLFCSWTSVPAILVFFEFWIWLHRLDHRCAIPARINQYQYLILTNQVSIPISISIFQISEIDTNFNTNTPDLENQYRYQYQYLSFENSITIPILKIL